VKSLENTRRIYLSASTVVFHYEEALYQVYAPAVLEKQSMVALLLVEMYCILKRLSPCNADTTAAAVELHIDETAGQNSFWRSERERTWFNSYMYLRNIPLASSFIFWNNSRNNQPILITFSTGHPEDT